VSESYQYKIESGIPVPPKRKAVRIHQKFQGIADRMKYGDSVIVDNYVECVCLQIKIGRKHARCPCRSMPDNVKYRVWKLAIHSDDLKDDMGPDIPTLLDDQGCPL